MSAALFLLGIVYGISNIFFFGINRIPNGSVLLILSSLFIFLFGLISEQIAAMRFESSQRLGVEEMLMRVVEQKEGITNYGLRITDRQDEGTGSRDASPSNNASTPDRGPETRDGE